MEESDLLFELLPSLGHPVSGALMSRLLLVKLIFSFPNRFCPLLVNSEAAKAAYFSQFVIKSHGLLDGFAAQCHTIKLIRGFAFQVIAIINNTLELSGFLIGVFELNLQQTNLCFKIFFYDFGRDLRHLKSCFEIHSKILSELFQFRLMLLSQFNVLLY